MATEEQRRALAALAGEIADMERLRDQRADMLSAQITCLKITYERLRQSLDEPTASSRVAVRRERRDRERPVAVRRATRVPRPAVPLDPN